MPKPRARIALVKIVGVAGRQHEGARAAYLIDERMTFGRPATARAADRAFEGPFAPPAEQCALTWVESIEPLAIAPVDPVSASKIESQMPCRLQRLKRL